MKKLILAGFLIAAIILQAFCSEPLIEKVKFASVEKAKELLTTEDKFTQSWSQFDIDSRMHKQHSTKAELFEFIAEQTLPWTSDEEAKLATILDEIDDHILEQSLKLDFPNEIYFIKTTAKEEGGAGGYTRSNYVVLDDDLFTQPNAVLKQIIIHELFHILTRSNPDFRKMMYEIIGFKLMPPIAYPDALKPYRITNPDAPQTDSYINLQADGQPVDCMMVLYSNKDYKGGDFFKYLNVGFLSLTGDSVKQALMHNNEPVIYDFKQVKGFFEQVGRNTQYIIHPEEILADNFAYTILNKSGLPNMEIIEQIRMKLKD